MQNPAIGPENKMTFVRIAVKLFIDEWLKKLTKVSNLLTPEARRAPTRALPKKKNIDQTVPERILIRILTSISPV